MLRPAEDDSNEISDKFQCRPLNFPQLEEGQVRGVTSTYLALSPVPVKVNVDRVGMRFEATVIVITDAFPPGNLSWSTGTALLQHGQAGSNWRT